MKLTAGVHEDVPLQSSSVAKKSGIQRYVFQIPSVHNIRSDYIKEYLLMTSHKQGEGLVILGHTTSIYKAISIHLNNSDGNASAS